MKVQKLAVLVFFLLATLVLPNALFAQQTITPNIVPACTNPPQPGPSPLTLATSTTPLICGPYKIEPKSSGNARIEVGTDSMNDTLALLNTKVTKTTASADDLVITFWANSYTSLPNDVPPQQRNYTVSSSGYFMRGTNPLSPIATKDSIGFSGYLDMPDNDGVVVWYPVGSNEPQYSWSVTNNNNIPAGNGVSKTFGDPPLDPTHHPLSMQVEVWVHLADPGPTTDKLALTAVQMQDAAPGGPPPNGTKPKKKEKGEKKKAD